MLIDTTIYVLYCWNINVRLAGDAKFSVIKIFQLLRIVLMYTLTSFFN